MIAESVAILGVTVCIIAIFIRSGNAGYALATLPVLIVPAANLLGFPIAGLLNEVIPGNQVYLLRSFVDVVGVAISCALVVLFSTKMKSPKKRKLYIGMCCLYSILLTCVFIYHALPRF